MQYVWVCIALYWHKPGCFLSYRWQVLSSVNMCGLGVSVCHTEGVSFSPAALIITSFPMALSHSVRLQLAAELWSSLPAHQIFAVPLFLSSFFIYPQHLWEFTFSNARSLFGRSVLMTWCVFVFSPRASVRLALSLLPDTVVCLGADVLMLWWGNGGLLKPSPCVEPPLPSPLLPTPFQPAKPWARKSQGASSL